MTPDAEYEGRRVERVDGGYLVLNAGKYRAQVTREDIRSQTRERVARFRDKKKDVTQDRYTGDEAKTDIDGSGNADVTQSVAVAKKQGRAAAVAFAKETAAKRNALVRQRSLVSSSLAGQ